MSRTGWFLGARKPHRTLRRAAYRPLLEGLEDRCLLSAVETLVGYGNIPLGNTDDGTFGPVDLGFAAHLSNPAAAHTFNQVYINNNGNVTVGGANSDFGAINFDTTFRQVFAPFMADVDTRASNSVTYGTGTLNGHAAFAVTWPQVAGYQLGNAQLNTFQVVFISRADVSPGDFDVEYNYDQIQWDAGFRETPAVVGFSGSTHQAGTDFTLPGSATSGYFLDSSPTGLVNGSRNSSVLGRYVFSFRDGVLDNNHAPNPSVGGPYTVAEGGSVTLDASGSTDADGDPLTYSWDVNGDGVFDDATGATPTLNWAQLQSLGVNDGPATFDVRVQVNDGHGPVTSSAATLSVTNTPPTLSLGGSLSTSEGEVFTLNLLSSDPGQDSIASWTVNWGDGNVETFTGNPGSVTHQYGDGAGNVVISATATDEDGTYAAGNTLAVQVNPVTPAPTLTGNTAVNEAAAYTLTLNSNAPTFDPVTSWTINWGDGTTDTLSGDLGSATHAYADGPNDYTITATATNNDGTFASLNSVSVHVNNVAPTLTLSGNASVDEGSFYTLNLAASDPGQDTITGWTINWGDGTTQTVSGNPASVQHVYADGPNNFNISATATDEDGTYAAGNTLPVHVNNVAPTLTITGVAVTDEASVYTLNLAATDPGQDTISSWTINWGDGTIETVQGNPGSVTHVYDGPASFTITASATDEDGTADAVSPLPVTVHDVPPTLDFSGGTAVNEGSPYSLALSAQDVGKDTVDHWTITWGDGSVQTVPGTAASVTHVYADGPNSYTITATATDEDGTYTAGNSVSVTVNNVPPTLTLGGAAAVDETVPYTLNLSSSDPGQDSIASWTVTWGDGNVETFTGNPASVQHVYTSGPNTYVISATATDEDGTYSAGNTVTVQVDGMAPTLTLAGNAAVNEGALYTLNLSAVEPGPHVVSGWTITWGDGSVQNVAGNPSSVTHTYADGPNNFTIAATATDDNGTYAAGNTVSVHVNNVAPTLTLSGNASTDEGATYTLHLAASDPGQDTITGWTISWGDGAVSTVTGNPLTASHVYADGPNDFTITATATDEDGSYAAGNAVSVHVNNIAPTLTLAGAATVDAGTPYTLHLAATDPGQDTIAGWTITWGDGSVQAVAGNPGTVTHVYAGGPADFTISATAADEDGSYSAGNTVAVHVNAVVGQNAAPVLSGVTSSALKVGNVAAGGAVTVSASFTDANPADSHTVIIHWGDGTETAGTITEANGSGTLSGKHTYATGGVYAISLTLADNHGGTDAGATSALVTGAGVQNGVLNIVGTGRDDRVNVSLRGDHRLKVEASFLSGKQTVNFSQTGIDRIVIRLGGGNDVAILGDNVTLPALVRGGGGNDFLQAGGGPTVLVGGAGNDVLIGGKGRDLLIGGKGNDLLYGSKDQNILIGGTTNFDSNDAALNAALAEWNSARARPDRIANLSGTGTGTAWDQRLNGNTFLNSDTVHDDGDADVLIIKALDWVFSNQKDWVW